MFKVNKIIEIKFGSHLYGTNTPKSDLDIKGIYLPTAQEIVLNTYKPTINISRKKEVLERNTNEDVDTEYFSLDRFLQLLTEGQTVALDFLFANKENIIAVTPEGEAIMKEIFDNRHKLINKNLAAFLGYAKAQAAKYGIKGSRLDAVKRVSMLLSTMEPSHKLNQYLPQLMIWVENSKEILSLEKTPLIELVPMLQPGDKEVLHLIVNGRACNVNAKVKYAQDMYNKILNEYGARAQKAHLSGGKDWKALSHAVRVSEEAYELLTTSKVTFPRPERELLLKIKTEQVPYEEVAEMIEQGIVRLYEAQALSILPEKSDKEWVNNFIYKIYSDIVKKDGT